MSDRTVREVLSWRAVVTRSLPRKEQPTPATRSTGAYGIVDTARKGSVPATSRQHARNHRDIRVTNAAPLTNLSGTTSKSRCVARQIVAEFKVDYGRPRRIVGSRRRKGSLWKSQRKT